jgi:hypothetical protein
VTEAVSRLEAMRDEWVEVKGEASTDDDIEAALKTKAKEVEEKTEKVRDRHQQLSTHLAAAWTGESHLASDGDADVSRVYV